MLHDRRALLAVELRREMLLDPPSPQVDAGLKGLGPVLAGRGPDAGAEIDLAAAVPARSGQAEELCAELIEFVRGEGLKARPGERLPGTTEVVESCFGKLKALEEGQSKSGFTRLVLSLGAMVSDRMAERISAALEQRRVRDVLNWCPREAGPVGPIAEETGIRADERRNKSGIKAREGRGQLSIAPASPSHFKERRSVTRPLPRVPPASYEVKPGGSRPSLPEPSGRQKGIGTRKWSSSLARPDRPVRPDRSSEPAAVPARARPPTGGGLSVGSRPTAAGAVSRDE
jgi:hypothetical protein